MSAKCTFYLLFSFVIGICSINAQQLKSNSNGNSTSEKVMLYTEENVKTKKKLDQKDTKKPTIKTSSNTSITANLNSKAEIEARAITARKTKNSSKRNISPDEAKKQRAARIQAIIESNKKKKFTQSKRKN